MVTTHPCATLFGTPPDPGWAGACASYARRLWSAKSGVYSWVTGVCVLNLSLPQATNCRLCCCRKQSLRSKEVDEVLQYLIDVVQNVLTILVG